MAEQNGGRASAKSDSVAAPTRERGDAACERRLWFVNRLLGARTRGALAASGPAIALDGALLSTCLCYVVWNALAGVSAFAVVPFALLISYVAIVRPLAAVARASLERRLQRPAHRTGGSLASLAIALVAAGVYAAQRASGRSVSLAPGAYAFAIAVLGVSWLVATVTANVRREWAPEA